MEYVRAWTLPAVLAVAQLALLPQLARWTGHPLDTAGLIADAVATVLVGIALGYRRRYPVAAYTGTVAAIALGSLATHPDVLAIAGFADMIALYSVSARRGTRIVFATAGAGLLLQIAVTLRLYGGGREFGATITSAAVVYLLVAALGHSRRKWTAARAAVAGKLADAEAERRDAAVTERRRLARELHDVSAHLLTSIVVTGSAAQRLADRQPSLTAEALDFAARTGKETLDTLRTLVAVLREPDPSTPADQSAVSPTGFASLATGFADLGQRVTVSADPVPERVEKVLGMIAREALTNTVRYAPGANVEVLVEAADGHAVLTVTDDGSAPGVAGLGSGHGLAGARERAEAAGGTLTAGPRMGGGWRVTAAVPVAGARAAGRRGPGEPRVRFADVALSVALGLLPVTFAIFADESDPAWNLDTADAALYALVLILHALPVMWRRAAPWAAFGAVLATSWLWPAVAGQAVPQSPWLFAAGAGTELAAVYAVAAYARRGWTTWLAAPLAAGSLSGVLVRIAASDGSLDGHPATTAAIAGAWAFLGVLGSMILFAGWGIGFTARIRRRRVAERDRSALSAATADAVAVAHAERIRIAAGLREDVLARTGAVVEAAERGQLDAVIGQARAGLAAMRDLLGSLRGDGDGARRDPQAAAAAIAGLCAEYRSDGREVALDAPAEFPSLAPDADVSAFRLVDAVLAGGDTGPAQVSMHGDGRYLRITVEGVPVAAKRPTVAGLRARLAAIGGGLSVDPAGTVRAWLPTRTVPEVTPWRSA
ncbi:MAG: hypothetical protein QOD41_4129 [Cryptosporangiaceae bacterium]|nr:hypothetical protein [Cryptosporangiaceae bacterium]